jgi:hypothetical protein
MFKALNWCAKCLFLYLVVAILAIRFAWVFTLPVWSVAARFHWTTLNRLTFSLSYFLPIFAAAGFIAGLIPFERLGRAMPRSFKQQQKSGFDLVPATLWAWVPVTSAFLFRYLSWSSRNSSVVDQHAITTGRFARFFGTLRMQDPSLFDPKWATDRFIFTGPMLFLMAMALTFYVRHRLFPDPATPAEPQATTPDTL